MSERENIVKEIDLLIDAYFGDKQTLELLLVMRRQLAVFGYRLEAHMKEVGGQAGLTNIRRKFAIAKEVVAARKVDAKEAIALAEARAETLNSTQDAREKEVWAIAEHEALKGKLDFIKQILGSMMQEIAFLTHEHKTINYYNTQEKDT